MPLPLRWSLVPVYGTYTRLDGTPAVGSVWFESASPVIVSGDDNAAQYVVPRKIEAVLDATGHFEVLLPSTNDPDINPKGWTYQVTESFSGGRKFAIDVPYANAPIDLVTWAQATPIPAPPLQYSYLTTADIGHNVASQTDMVAAKAQATNAAASAAAAQASAAASAAGIAAAVNTANTALDTANTANANVSGAITASNAATEASGEAVNTANAAAGIAAAASSTANNAAADAATALATANGIDAKATQAQTDAAEALDTANGIAATAAEALDTANTASTVAEDANTTAEAAETAASAAQTAAEAAQAVAGKWATPRDVSSTGPVQITAAGIDGTEDIALETAIADGALSIAKTSGLQAALDARSPMASFKNKIINGDFDIWQRGATLPMAEGVRYLADRWYGTSGGSQMSMSRQNFVSGQADVPDGPRFYIRSVVNSVAGFNNIVALSQKIEGVATFAGKTITLSFWMRADAARPVGIEFSQAFGSGGSPTVTGIGAQKVMTQPGSAWSKVVCTIDIPSIAGKTLVGSGTLALNLWLDAGSNYDARTGGVGQQSGTVDISHVQVEEGSTATAFEQRPLAIEVTLCQRYFYVFSTTSGTAFAVCAATSTASAIAFICLPVAMRDQPACSVVGNVQAFGSTAVSTPNVGPSSNQIIYLQFQINTLAAKSSSYVYAQGGAQTTQCDAEI